MKAAARGHTETVAALLAAPGLDVNAATGDGWTSLMWAVRGGYTETVTVLLTAPGLDASARAVGGTNARMVAALNGHTELVKVLHIEASRRRLTLLPAMGLPSPSTLSLHTRSLPLTGTALEDALEDALERRRGRAIEKLRSTVLPAPPGSTTVARLRRPRPPPSSPSPLPSPPPKRARTR